MKQENYDLKNFKDNIVFAYFKNKPIRNCRSFRKKAYDLYGKVNFREVYIAIINYQIKKYGRSIDDYVYHPDYRKASVNSRNRKYEKRNR